MSQAIIVNTKTIVNLINNQVLTTSINIADFFNKQHKEVLRKIENLKSELPMDFWERNFTLSKYQSKTGKNTITENPMYLLTRKGFSFLAMGFTGKKANQFKIAYIEAFDAMEAELKKQPKQAALSQEPQTTQDQGNQLSTVNERVRINNLVKAWAKSKKKSHFECWRIIHKEFAISTIAKIRSNQIQDVCNFIMDKMDNPAERPTPPLPVSCSSSLPVPKPELTFLPVEQKLPPLMFEYEPADWKKDWVEFHAKQMLEQYDYKTYAYNAYMLSCKASDIFNDFEKKITELMKDYDKISKPVYKAMFSKIIDRDYDADILCPHSKEERDRNNNCTSFTSTMWQTIDNTYSKLMYSKRRELHNEVDQMIQTLRYTAKILDM